MCNPIDGVVFVVDPGFSKQKVYNARTNADTLLVNPISRAAAMQRAGRAGRTQPGKCFRLYTAKAHVELLEVTYPEIVRTNLASVLLTLFKLGIEDVVHFDFMDPPSPESMMRALNVLHLLGAVDDECALTSRGRHMAEFPLDPQLSRMLVRGVELGVGDELSSIVALLNVPLLYMRPRHAQKQADRAHAQFTSNDGDHISLLNVFEQFEQAGSKAEQTKWAWDNYVRERSVRSALSVKRQLRGIIEKCGLRASAVAEVRSHAIRRSLISGFFQHVARLENDLICK